MPLEPNAVLKYFSLAVAVVFGAAALWVAARAAWVGQFDAPLFSSFLLFSLMALSFYYFEKWYERWRREAGVRGH